MKTTQKFIVRTVLALFVLSITAVFLPVQIVKAGSLTNATDTLSEVWQTQLTSDADVTDTSISVIDGSGIAVSDVLFVTDGTATNEERTVSSVNGDTIGVDAIEYGWNSSSGIDVTVLTGITHTIQFDVATAANIDKIRFTFDNTAEPNRYSLGGDRGSFSGVTFANLSNITQAGTNTTAYNDMCELNLDNAAVAQGTTVSLDIQDVRNPNGSTTTSYSVTVETLDVSEDVIDSSTLYFGVDTGVIVSGDVSSTLSFTIADNGTQNNSTDSTTSETIALGTLETGAVDGDDTGTGYGIDGNLLTVSTNAANGYNVTIQDTVFGLVNDSYIGAGRPNGSTDNGIDDISAAGAWPTYGVESYGYAVGAAFDGGGGAPTGTYSPFTDTAAVIKTTNNPISAETTYVTIRTQRAGTTPAGNYTDQIIYIITPNF